MIKLLGKNLQNLKLGRVLRLDPKSMFHKIKVDKLNIIKLNQTKKFV